MASSRPDPGSISNSDSTPHGDGAPQPDSTPGADGLSRREVLGLGAAVVASAAVGSTLESTLDSARSPAPAQAAAAAPAATADELRPTIRPRQDWAGDDQGVTGELVPEDDVRFLLVHHTASTNDYGPDDVVGQIRGFYDFHTGPEKGWPDVAYNFFIDRYGVIWEGRQGSIAGPVRGDATGGSQGFGLLCSLIGNHAEAPVTGETRAALTQLLAWLGATYQVDTAPGATTTFVSRGSNRWASGVEVTARTISGHREMSTTSCPGDFAFDLLDREIPEAVTRLRTEGLGATSTTDPADDTTSTTDPAQTDPTGTDTSGDATGSDPILAEDSAGATTTDGSGGAAGSTEATAPPTTILPGANESASAPGLESDGPSWPLIIAGGVMAAVAAGVGAVSRLFDRGPSSGSGPSGR